MFVRGASRLAMLVVGLAPVTASAGFHHGHHGHNHGGGLGFGGGVPVFLLPYGVMPVFAPVAPGVGPPFRGGMNLAVPPPPPPALGAPRVGAPTSQHRSAARAKELLTIGDRLFRVGNFSRAVERYQQALKADPTSAEPRVRLSQVALQRGDYAEAAAWLREAQATQPDWLEHPFDVQALYREPGAFASKIAALEAHLQAQPNDRDAWLVLGAQWFLSGRTQKAADIFVRLSDRRPDATLAAFLDVTRSNER